MFFGIQCPDIITINLPDEALIPSFIALPGKKSVTFMIFSVYLLLRGHHLPGGGFVGGLIAGSSYALYALAFDVASARKRLKIDPISLAAMGLLIACLSGIPALLYGKAFLTGIWWEIPLFFGFVFVKSIISGGKSS